MCVASVKAQNFLALFAHNFNAFSLFFHTCLASMKIITAIENARFILPVMLQQTHKP